MSITTMVARNPNGEHERDKYRHDGGEENKGHMKHGSRRSHAKTADEEIEHGVNREGVNGPVNVTVYILSHGETSMTKEDQKMNICDPCLSCKGFEQSQEAWTQMLKALKPATSAESSKTRSKSKKPIHLFTSPMKSAIGTSMALADVLSRDVGHPKPQPVFPLPVPVCQNYKPVEQLQKESSRISSSCSTSSSTSSTSIASSIHSDDQETEQSSLLTPSPSKTTKHTTDIVVINGLCSAPNSTLGSNGTSVSEAVSMGLLECAAALEHTCHSPTSAAQIANTVVTKDVTPHIHQHFGHLFRESSSSSSSSSFATSSETKQGTQGDTEVSLRLWRENDNPPGAFQRRVLADTRRNRMRIRAANILNKNKSLSHTGPLQLVDDRSKGQDSDSFSFAPMTRPIIFSANNVQRGDNIEVDDPKRTTGSYKYHHYEIPRRESISVAHGHHERDTFIGSIHRAAYLTAMAGGRTCIVVADNKAIHTLARNACEYQGPIALLEGGAPCAVGKFVSKISLPRKSDHVLHRAGAHSMKWAFHGVDDYSSFTPLSCPASAKVQKDQDDSARSSRVHISLSVKSAEAKERMSLLKQLRQHKRKKKEGDSLEADKEESNEEGITTVYALLAPPLEVEKELEKETDNAENLPRESSAWEGLCLPNDLNLDNLVVADRKTPFKAHGGSIGDAMPNLSRTQKPGTKRLVPLEILHGKRKLAGLIATLKETKQVACGTFRTSCDDESNDNDGKEAQVILDPYDQPQLPCPPSVIYMTVCT